MLDSASLFLCFFALLLVLLGFIIGSMACRRQPKAPSDAAPDAVALGSTTVYYKLSGNDAKLHLFEDCFQLKKARSAPRPHLVCEDCLGNFDKKSR